MNDGDPATAMGPRLQAVWQRLRDAAATVVVGMEEPFQQMAIALFSRGHVLVEGVPGTGKTLTAKTLARLVGGDFGRIQFTPDIMPSDVVGTSVFDLATNSFHVRTGPIFAQILLVDEINRAPAKTQAALLEGMEERQVTIEGQTFRLPSPFLVAATQNPVEYEGTYPLPEAQLDRFQFKVLVDYPTADEEVDVLRRHRDGGDPHNLVDSLPAVVSAADVEVMQREAARVRIDDAVLRYITEIGRASRQSPDLVLGASPRASVAVMRGAQVLALMEGRDFVIPDDVKALVPPAYRHRIILKPEAEIQGVTPDDAVARILAGLEVPR
ncbi:MAG TPA: MoxR family ATPase [Chloroflexota bacterium]|nr:MoxR family ATPase [Chloroflexota bacterium]